MVEIGFSEINISRGEKKRSTPDVLGYKESLQDILGINIIKLKDKLIKKNREYRYNYQTKGEIMDNLRKDIRELKEKRLELKNKRAESIINKALIKERLKKIEEIWDKRNIPEERRVADREIIQKALEDNGVTNMYLHNITKILRGTKHK